MWKEHWPEYAIEAWGLGTFMVSAGIFATLLYASISPVPIWIPVPLVRDILMGMAMGLTAIGIIYSPWGKRSGAHLNPAVTLTFFRLGKLTRIDALGYVISQFIGGSLGVALVAVIVGNPFTAKPPNGLNYIVTEPGYAGWVGAIAAEAIMSMVMMSMVLTVSNKPRWAHLTGVFAGCLVAIFIIVASPISGMSINPARSFASAVFAHSWQFFWIYYFTPPLAMLIAAELYIFLSKNQTRKLCGKLCPNGEMPCLCQNPCDACCPHQE